MKRVLFALTLLLLIRLAAVAEAGSTAFTYQGQLKRDGQPYTGTCDFQFGLWNAASAGLGTTAAPINQVSVVNGLFTVVLDFGPLTGEQALWIQTAVQCSGDTGFTPLEPRQPLSAAPFALNLRAGTIVANLDPASQIISTLSGWNLVPKGIGLDGQAHVGVSGRSGSDGGYGVQGYASGNNAVGVHGSSYGESGGSGVTGLGGPAATAGVLGSTINPNGSGVYGQAAGGGSNSAGVFGLNKDGAAIWGRSTGGGSAVYAENTGSGLAGRFAGHLLVELGNFEVRDGSIRTAGIESTAPVPGGIGVIGRASGTNSAGVLGLNVDSAAIWGRSTGGGSAIYGENGAGGFAGRFVGPVKVEGTLTKSAGAFKIDHPLDPANRFLSHSFVESPDMKNIYDGVVVLDGAGQAVVQLPDYFEALNRDYRYQLTCVGGVAPVYIAQKVSHNQFRIAGGTPGLEVSWQVTGIRRDAYAEENRIVVDEAKRPEEQGFYLYPAGFGAGEERRINRMHRAADEPAAEEPHSAATITKPRP